MNSEEKKANPPTGAVPLEEEQLEQANGGMKIILVTDKLREFFRRLKEKIVEKYKQNRESGNEGE